MEKRYFIYIMANEGGSVLYTGVTNDLRRRVYEHKHHLAKGFTSRYNLDRLVYYEVCDDPQTAIAREKQIKAGPRKSKELLIAGMNHPWRDLAEELWPEEG